MSCFIECHFQIIPYFFQTTALLFLHFMINFLVFYFYSLIFCFLLSKSKSIFLDRLFLVVLAFLINLNKLDYDVISGSCKENVASYSNDLIMKELIEEC